MSVVVRNLDVEFAKLGIRSSIVISNWEASQLTFDSNRDRCFRFALVGATSWTSLAKSLLFAPVRLWRTWSLLRREGVDAVGFHYAGLDALGVATLKKLRLYHGRLVLSFHGSDMPRQMPWLARRLWRLIVSEANAITACSHSLASAVCRELSAPEDRMHAIANGVDAELFSPAARAGVAHLQLPSDFLVSVGSYIPLKGHITLLKAYSLVADLHPKLHLVIVGKEGDERQRLATTAAALGLLERVRFVVDAHPPDVAAIIASAMACVQPSRSEAFGIVLLEAGASGTPVLATNIGGHAELLRHGETGLLFRVDDIEACADQLRILLDSPRNASLMAERFRSEVLQRYSWTACARSYQAIMAPTAPSER